MNESDWEIARDSLRRQLDGTADELQLTLHRVTGTAPTDTRLVARLPLTP